MSQLSEEDGWRQAVLRARSRPEVRSGIGTLGEKTLHAAVKFYLEPDPESYDVNVHPAKLEVRFRSDSEVYDAVFRAVKDAI